MLGTIITFVIILAVLVLVHELGHFVSAKRMGIAVEEFGIGFPPRIVGFKRGETVYSINWLPLGGFVKIKGEVGEDSNDRASFSSRPAWQRIIVLAAGVGMNFVLAFVLFSGGFMIGVPQEVTDADLSSHAVRDVRIMIMEVAPKSPAAAAGIVAGDAIVSIDKRMFANVDDVVAYINANAAHVLSLEVVRGKQHITSLAQPVVFEGADNPRLGIAMVRVGLVRYGFFQSLYQGARATKDTTMLIISALGILLYGLFVGNGVGSQISGPVGVAVLTGQIARLGFAYLINFTAILSINLGILNILPIPALDGGRVLFVLIEKLKGSKVSPRIESLAHTVGFMLLIALILFVTYRDILQYGGSVLKSITRLFG